MSRLSEEGAPPLTPTIRMRYAPCEAITLAKTIKATFRRGRFEPLEPVDFPEGADLLVTVEEAAAANQWFAELHQLFDPVRKELTGVSEETIDRRIARAVKAVRARKRAKA